MMGTASDKPDAPLARMTAPVSTPYGEANHA
jgi:hypothetical protein